MSIRFPGTQRTAARSTIPLMNRDPERDPEWTTEAPAKLNLRLRVLGRRNDGFHEIETLIVALPGLADRLTIEWRSAGGVVFDCGAAGVPADESNLAVRALRAFEQQFGVRADCRLRLDKRIPHGAGLGGGSSDAAAVLRLLARRFGPVDELEFASLAAMLGSDVPFFLGSSAAWCRGRGEQIEPAPGIPALPVLLLKPLFLFRHMAPS